MMSVLWAGGAVMALAAIASIVISPVAALQDLCAHLRAAGIVLGFAARAAWRERTRWHAAIETARRGW